MVEKADSETNILKIQSIKRQNIRQMESQGRKQTFMLNTACSDAGLIVFERREIKLDHVLTNSKSKIGSYQFTTLEPSLGDMHGYILADIPGLIEGASEGKGLGHKFLRHIKRTKMLLHCISLENEDLVSVSK